MEKSFFPTLGGEIIPLNEVPLRLERLDLDFAVHD